MARGGPRIALFLGRIYPIKGLPMLIEAWAHARPAGWILQIAGPDEAGHQNQLEKAVSAAGLGHVVSFAGPLEYGMKKSAFFDADLFVLPSHSESFGIVVAEALAHGLPVLTTTGAPWSILPESGCGWWVDPTVDGITEGLRQATALDTETLRSMGAKGRALVSAKFGWKRAANLILSTYEAILTDEITHNPACFNRPWVVKMEWLLTAKRKEQLPMHSQSILPLEVPVRVAFRNMLLRPVQTNCGFPFCKMRLVILNKGRR